MAILSKSSKGKYPASGHLGCHTDESFFFSPGLVFLYHTVTSKSSYLDICFFILNTMKSWSLGPGFGGLLKGCEDNCTQPLSSVCPKVFFKAGHGYLGGICSAMTTL